MNSLAATEAAEASTPSLADEFDGNADDDVAIKVDNIWKRFRTGQFVGMTLARDVQSFFAKLRGKENPNTKLALDRDELTGADVISNQWFWAVKGASLEVKKGECVVILGRNGAGKSTLLQVICQITEASSGSVTINGRIASLLQAGVGFNEELTGRENIFLNGTILGLNRNEVIERIPQIADFSEIEEFLDTPVKRYSSGMVGRLGFSVAAHLGAEIMILDEVFATGDRVYREKCIDKIQELAAGGTTILLVSHMVEMLGEAVDRSIFMAEGEVIYDGDKDVALALYLEEADTIEEAEAKVEAVRAAERKAKEAAAKAKKAAAKAKKAAAKAKKVAAKAKKAAAANASLAEKEAAIRAKEEMARKREQERKEAEQKKLLKNRESLFKQLQADPLNPNLYAELGEIWDGLEDHDKAYACFRNALALSDDDGEDKHAWERRLSEIEDSLMPLDEQPLFHQRFARSAGAVRDTFGGSPLSILEISDRPFQACLTSRYLATSQYFLVGPELYDRLNHELPFKPGAFEVILTTGNPNHCDTWDGWRSWLETLLPLARSGLGIMGPLGNKPPAADTQEEILGAAGRTVQLVFCAGVSEIKQFAEAHDLAFQRHKIGGHVLESVAAVMSQFGSRSGNGEEVARLHRVLNARTQEFSPPEDGFEFFTFRRHSDQ